MLDTVRPLNMIFFSPISWSNSLNVSVCLLHVVYFDIAAFILVSLIGSVSKLLIKIYVLFAFRAYKKFEAFRFITGFDCFHKCCTNPAILIAGVDSQSSDIASAVFFMSADSTDYSSVRHSFQEYVSFELVSNIFNCLFEGRYAVIAIPFSFALIGKLLQFQNLLTIINCSSQYYHILHFNTKSKMRGFMPRPS